MLERKEDPIQMVPITNCWFPSQTDWTALLLEARTCRLHENPFGMGNYSNNACVVVRLANAIGIPWGQNLGDGDPSHIVLRPNNHTTKVVISDQCDHCFPQIDWEFPMSHAHKYLPHNVQKNMRRRFGPSWFVTGYPLSHFLFNFQIF